jgi:hypothetical protein
MAERCIDRFNDLIYRTIKQIINPRYGEIELFIFGLSAVLVILFFPDARRVFVPFSDGFSQGLANFARYGLSYVLEILLRAIFSLGILMALLNAITHRKKHVFEKYALLVFISMAGLYLSLTGLDQIGENTPLILILIAIMTSFSTIASYIITSILLLNPYALISMIFKRDLLKGFIEDRISDEDAHLKDVIIMTSVVCVVFAISCLLYKRSWGVIFMFTVSTSQIIAQHAISYEKR